MSIGLWLEKWNRFGAERIALVDGDSGQRWTYGELFRRSQACAAWLGERGVGPGDRVAWTEKNRPSFFEVLFACARLGAILVPVNWRLAPPEVAHIVSDAEPTLILDEAALTAMEAAIARSTARSEAPIDVPAYQAEDASPLIILYTSGTTGRPKGAILTHGSITANSLNTTIACDLRADDSTATYTPLFHTGGVNVLSMPLFHRGGKVVLFEGFEPEKILRVVGEEEVSILFGVPTIFEMLRDSPSFASADLSSVRFLLCGGAPCPLGLIDDYARRGLVFRQGYGLTEVGPNCFSLRPEDATRKAGTVGFPVMHCQARIVDSEGQDVAAGDIGELWLKGPHVCGGYWRNPEASAAALKGGWWATGDLFRTDDEGYFKVVGRKKEMYISGGENVYPAEVEQALRRFPGLRECAVIGVADERWGEVGHAYVAPASIDIAALRLHLEDSLAKFKIPKAFFPVASLPLNASGKVDRRALKALQPGAAQAASTEAEAPKSRGALVALLALALTLIFSAPARAADKPEQLYGHDDAVKALALEGDALVSADRKGRALLWDLDIKKPIAAFPDAEAGILAVALRGKLAAIGSEDGRLRIFKTDETIKVAASALPQVKLHRAIETGVEDGWDRPAVTALAFDPEGERLAVGFGDGAVREWAIKDGKAGRSFEKMHERRVSGLAYVMVGKRREVLVSVGWDGKLRLSTGRRPGKSLTIGAPEITGLSIQPGEPFAVVTDHAGALVRIDLKKKKVKSRSKNPQGWVSHPAILEDGKLLAASPNENGLVRFGKGFDILERKSIASIDVKETRVIQALVADAARILCGNSDGSLSLFEQEP